jgi:predicted RecA/RadA family phage recombinase
MKNYLQEGDSVTVPAPANVSSGDGVLLGTLFGVAATDADSGANVTIKTTGVFTLPKLLRRRGQLVRPFIGTATSAPPCRRITRS